MCVLLLRRSSRSCRSICDVGRSFHHAPPTSMCHRPLLPQQPSSLSHARTRPPQPPCGALYRAVPHLMGPYCLWFLLKCCSNSRIRCVHTATAGPGRGVGVR